MGNDSKPTAKHQRGSRFPVVLLGAIAALRIVAVVATRDDPVFRVPYLDAAFYHFWAQSLATAAGDFADAYFLGPLYPHFLSWLYRLGSADPFYVRLVQTGLGLINIILVYFLGSRHSGRLTGSIAAIFLACYGTVFFYEGLLVMETLQMTLVLAGCSMLLFLSPSPMTRTLQVAAAAVFLGTATLGRGTVLLLWPIAIGVLWSGASQLAPSRKSTRSLQVLGLTVLWSLMLLPALIHNGRHGVDWTLTTNAGVNFYAGNNSESRGRFRPPPGVEFFTGVPQLAVGQELPPAIAKRALTVTSVAGTARAADSAYWFGQSWKWIQNDPGGFVQLLLRKTALVLQGREIGQIESPAFHRARLPVLQLFWVGWSVVLPLAVLGLWSGWRNPHSRRRTQILLATSTALLLPGVLFFVTARYRLVAVPLLCVLAGAGATTVVFLWRENRRMLGVWTVLLLLLASLTRLGGQPPRSAAGWENAQMAERLYAVGDLEAAIAFQQKAAELLPQRMETQLNLALYWSERRAPGDLQRAEELLRNLVKRYPDQPILLFNWASLLEQSGRRDEALPLYRRTLQLDPGFEPARRNLRTYEAP